MSKLLWKTLFVTQALLGAALVFFAGAARAVESTSLLADTNKGTTQAVQGKKVENQSPESLLMAKKASESSFAATAASTASVLQGTQAESTIVDKASAEPSANKVAANPSELKLSTPATEASAPTAVTNPVDGQVAQANPAAPSNNDVLEQLNRYNKEGSSNSQDQITNVTQLRDVSPSDWAYEALRTLIANYGCLQGYPDRTFRGNRALSRYEFAAGLNACLTQIERIITTRTANFVTRRDLETIQRLVSDFRTELTTLGARIDKLEGRVALLEDRQFSTTTKLQGEVIFALTDEFNQKTRNNTVFQDRVRLTFNTSFTGKDRLVTRLAAGNAQYFSTPGGTAEGTQTFQLGSDNNRVNVDWLAYYSNFGSSKIYLAATGGIHSDYVPTLNPYFDDGDGGNGALSTFATQNPIYRIGGGAGGAISLGVGPLKSILGPSTLTLGYLAGATNGNFANTGFGANNPREKAGLFDGDFAALGQLNFNVGDRIGVGVTYVHGYHNSGTDIFDVGGGVNGRIVGTNQANNPSGFASTLRGLPVRPTVTNSYGGEAALRFTNNISLSGFGTYTQATVLGQGRADIWTYGAGLAFADLGKKGNVLGLFAGVEPTLRGLSPNLRPAGGFNRDNAYHLEGFYKYQLNDNISVTPGIIWLTAPNQRDDNKDVVIGTLRTTFTF